MGDLGGLWGSGQHAKSPWRQVLLREMFRVQRGDKGGTPLLRAGTEYGVVRIWGKVVLARNGHELVLFSQQVNDFA